MGVGGFHIVEEGIMSYLFIRMHQRRGRAMKKKQRDRCVHCIFYDSSCCCEYVLVFLTRGIWRDFHQIQILEDFDDF